MTSWGTGPWGTGAYGGPSSPLTVTGAVAISTHEVVVTLSKPPLDRTGILPGDASNAGSWSVTVPATLQVLRVAGVAPYERPLRWLIRTLDRLPDSLAVGRVSAVGLKDAGGALVGLPNAADFAGVTELAVSTPSQLAATQARGARDLKNIPSPSIGETSIGGTLEVAGGDYQLSEGAALVKKLIGRRLMTTPGEFYHLPNYGVGFKVKQPLPGGAIVKLQALVQKQILLEPDVGAVKVQITQDKNTLTCIVRATLAKTGQEVTVAMNSPITQG